MFHTIMSPSSTIISCAYGSTQPRTTPIVLTWYVEICWFSSLMVLSYSVKSGASILQRYMYITELDKDRGQLALFAQLAVTEQLLKAGQVPAISGFSVGSCINEEEGYLLPT